MHVTNTAMVADTEERRLDHGRNKHVDLVILEANAVGMQASGRRSAWPSMSSSIDFMVDAIDRQASCKGQEVFSRVVGGGEGREKAAAVDAQRRTRYR